MKNNYVRLGGVLFIICAVAAGILAFLNDATKDIIKMNDEMASMDPAVIEAVMPGAFTFIDLEDTSLVEAIKADNNKFTDLKVAVDDAGNELGYALKTFSPVTGYAGDIEIYVGISPDGKVTGSAVTITGETSGIGTKVNDPAFKDQFIGRDASIEIADSDYDAISGATKSSVSFLSAVNNAINIYNQFLKK